jgi:hypothetical protein
MGKPTKKPAPPRKRIKRVSQIYVYCENPKCNVHVIVPDVSTKAGDPTADPSSIVANWKAGNPCPVCHTQGSLQAVTLDNQIDIDLDANPDPVTVRIMPPVPYGGIPLCFGDNDKDKRWGMQVRSDADLSDAHFIAELKRDLMRLGFYDPARSHRGETLGEYSTHLLGAVLDFKRHLTTYYQMPPVGSLTNRAEKLIANAELPEAATDDNVPADPTVAKTLSAVDKQCYFPKGGLWNPLEVGQLRTEFVAGLAIGTSARGTTTIEKALESWFADWLSARKLAVPETGKQLDAIVAYCETLSSTVGANKTDGLRATIEADTAECKSTASNSSLSAEEKAAALTTLRDRINARAAAPVNAVPDYNSLEWLTQEVTKIDRQLLVKNGQKYAPGATKKPPNNADLSVQNWPVVAGVPGAADVSKMSKQLASALKQQSVRAAWLASVLKALPARRGNNTTVAQRRRNKLALFLGLASNIAERAQGVTTVLNTLTDIASTDGTKKRNWPQLSKSTQDPKGLAKNLLSDLNGWLQQGPAPGVIQRLRDRWSALPNECTAVSVGWIDPTAATIHSNSLRNLEQSLRELNTTLQKLGELPSMDAYRLMLREYGIIDRGTAICIKEMATLGRLVVDEKTTRCVFLVPQGIAKDRDAVVENTNEVVDFASSDLWQVLTDLINAPPGYKEPPPLQMYYWVIYHEGGPQAFRGWRGMNLINFGIDWWSVGGNTIQQFSEENTSGSRLSAGRGWGPTQNTKFDSATPEADDDLGPKKLRRLYAYRSGIPYGFQEVPFPSGATQAAGDGPADDPEGFETYNTGSGQPSNPSAPTPTVVALWHPEERPWPATIADANTNLNSGVKIFADKFRAEVRRPARPCSFVNSAGKARDCKQCLKRFKIVYQMENGKRKTLPKYNNCNVIDTSQSDFDAFKNSRGAANSYYYTGVGSGLTASPPDGFEYPCSWLRAAMGYAGTGPQAFARAMDIIADLPNNPKVTGRTDWP